MSFLEENDITIACLQETWLGSGDKSVYQSMQEHGYKIVKYERKDKRGGGVAILYNSNVQFKRATLNASLNFATFEYVCGRVFWNGNWIFIINLYRPPYSIKHQYTVKHFNEEFQSLLTFLSEQKDQSLIIGDFNINVSAADDPNVKDFLNHLSTNGMMLVPTNRTHVRGGTLDLVIIDKNLQENGINVRTDEGFSTDHFPLLLNLKGNDLSKENVCYTKIVRDFHKLDEEKFISDLKLTSLLNHNEFSILSAEEAVDLYNNTLKELFERHCPAVLKRYKPKNYKSEWFNGNLQKIKQNKRRQERKFKKRPTVENKKMMIQIRNIYNFELKKARSEFYHEKISKYINEPKQLFGTLNKITGHVSEKILPT